MKRIACLILFALTFVLGGAATFATDTHTTSDSGRPPRQFVTIQNFSYNPATITVPAETFVVWTNRDNVDHSVTGDGRVGPSSGRMSPGEQSGFLFHDPGTYTYHCIFHANMHGTVIVTPAGGSTGNTPSAPPADNNQQMPNTGTSSSAQATATANSSSNTTNNYYSAQQPNNQTTTSSSSETQSPAPATQSSSDMPVTMPDTGATGAAAALVLATTIGSGAYYWFRRKGLGA